MAQGPDPTLATPDVSDLMDRRNENLRRSNVFIVEGILILEEPSRCLKIISDTPA